MSLRSRIEGRISGRPGFGGGRIGGYHFPQRHSGVEGRLDAIESALRALRDGVVDLAGEVDRERRRAA